MLGLDVSGYSVPYVATWAGREDGAKLVLASGQRVVRAVNMILDALLGSEDTTAEDVAA